MSVSCLKDGRWICVYYKGKKQKREYFGRGPEGERQANQRDEELKTQGEIRTYTRYSPETSATTFADLALAYYDYKSKADLTPSSSAVLYYVLTGVILPEIGHLQPARLTHKRLDDYVKARLATPKTVNRGTKEAPIYKNIKDNKGRVQYISRSAAHRELCDIQAILNWAVTKEYLIANPVIGHKKPKKKKNRFQPPTVQETQKILEESAPHLIRALKISFYTGLRPGETELFRLTWDDVDMVKRTIYIVSADKGGLPYRNVPIHPDLHADLTAWAKEDRKKPVNNIITFNDQPIKSVKNAFKAAKRRAGITRRIRMYDFRHAAVTNMLEADGDLKSVSEIAGHSRVDTTMAIYQHTNLAMHRKQIDKIPSLRERAAGSDPKIIDYQAIREKSKARKKEKKNE